MKQTFEFQFDIYATLTLACGIILVMGKCEIPELCGKHSKKAFERYSLSNPPFAQCVRANEILI